MTEDQIKALLEENEALRKQLSDKDGEIASLDARIAKLQDVLFYLRKTFFGQMSEKHLVISKHSLDIFS
ncbi:MAG: hypothetical protein LKI59_05180 [Bacteroidales bacterium]|jgi:predicted  nucleic acid-binding Zn-ribbon protein|nr:hypothetical protein [Bacteroidales bacterium]